MPQVECQECHGSGAPCGNLGDNNHCGNCAGAGLVDPLQQATEQLVSTLLAAQTDIRQWVALAKRQRQELPNCDHLPCGPTVHGITGSECVISNISECIRAYRQASNG